jgi:hypothetical protein
MKKIYSLLIIVVISYSCSNDDIVSKDNPQQRKPGRVINALDPTKLARVIFDPGTTYEVRHFFYNNGLVRKLTKADGTVLKDFTYNSNNDMVLMHYYVGNQVYTTTYTYDSAHHVTTIGGFPYTYDAINNRYYDTYTPGPSTPPDPECPTCYSGLISREIRLSNEFLAIRDISISQDFDGTQTYDFYENGIIAGYSGNNNLSLSGLWDNPSWSHFVHDNKINPLKAAFLPLLRADAAGGGNLFGRKSEYCSGNNVTAVTYETGDPERDEYIIEYNAMNLPKKTIHNSYYFNPLGVII